MNRTRTILASLALGAIALSFAGTVLADGFGEQMAPAEKPDSIGEETYEIGVVDQVFRTVQDNSLGFEHRTQKVHVTVTSGPHKGEQFDMDNGILGDSDQTALHVGQKIVIDRMVKSDGSIVNVMRDRDRIPAMIWLGILFIILSAVTGGLRGVTSILGLAVSVGILLKLVVPWIVAGHNPMVSCLIGAYLIALTSLYLAHGFNKRTTIALLSTCITLLLSAGMALLFVHAAQLFGMGSEDSMYLQTGAFANLDLRGLLLGGIIIGALGVLDDITTAQTASIDEISKANPRMTFRQLYASGMSVGREHIASLINTLALAYVGASLPLFLLFNQNGETPTWMILNSEFIAEEVIRTLVGSATLLLAVPIATWMAATLLRNRTGHVIASHGHAHHHH